MKGEDIKNLRDYREFIGRTIYIHHPGDNEADALWGTIDCVSPHIFKRVITGFSIKSYGIFVVTEAGEFDLNNWKIYLADEKTQEQGELISWLED